jgi:glycosyltransferase involved in cell wall biosynthesis
MINILHITPDFNLSSGVTTHVVTLLQNFSKMPDYRVHFITNGGDALQRLEKLNIQFDFFPFVTGIKNIFYLYPNYYALTKYCKENKIDIIHSHHRYPEFIASLVAKRLQIKTVTSALSFVKGYRRLSFRSDRIIADSNSVRDFVEREFNVPSYKVSTLYSCVRDFPVENPTETIKLKESLQIPKNHKVLLFVGRLESIKGFDTLLNAFSLIRRTQTNITLLLIGSANRRIRKNLLSLSQEDIRYVLPSITYHRYYHLSDVVILPSRRDPFPYVMLETGLNKKAFIGGNVDGIAEFIEDGKDGLLFTPGDEQTLAHLILQVLNDSSMAARLGANLYRKVKSLPTCNQYCEKLDSMYHELLSLH